jgi:hypothetical protein
MIYDGVIRASRIARLLLFRERPDPGGDGRATVVPIHAGETIGPGLLSKILRDAEIRSELRAKL